MHPWDVSAKEAIAIQQKLREKVNIRPLPKKIFAIAGVDVSLERYGTELFAGIVVCSYPGLEVLERSLVKVPVSFPYIPGLLSFREIPGLIKCFTKLKHKPDVLMVDGQGITHPRKLGIASHLGVVLNMPTIGIAKSKLYGSFVEPQHVGEHTLITDPKTGEEIGVAYKSKERSKPIIISPGHKCNIEDALRLTKACLKGYRLPEPTRHAHLAVNEFRMSDVA